MSIETTPLTENYIRNNASTLNWQLLCQYQVMTPAFLTEMITYLAPAWYEVSKFQPLDNTFVVANKNQLNWIEICSRPNLVTEATLQSCFSFINWCMLCKYYKLSESFLRLNKLNINFANTSRYQTLSENFMNDFKDKLSWDLLSANQKMSASFLNTHRERVNWKLVSQSQILTEATMNQFKDRIDWYLIGQSQSFSEVFFKDWHHRLSGLTFQCINFSENIIRQFFDSFNAGSIWQLYNCSETFLNQFKSYVDYNAVSKFQTLTENYMNENKSLLNWSNLSLYQTLSQAYIASKFDLVNWANICEAQLLDDTFVNANLTYVDWTTTSYNYRPNDQNLLDTYVYANNYNSDNWLYVDEAGKLAALNGKYTVVPSNNQQFIECYVVCDSNNVLRTYNRKFTLVLNGMISTVNSFNINKLDAPGILADTLANANANKKITEKVYKVWALVDTSALLNNNKVRSGNIIVKQLM